MNTKSCAKTRIAGFSTFSKPRNLRVLPSSATTLVQVLFNFV